MRIKKQNKVHVNALRDVFKGAELCHFVLRISISAWACDLCCRFVKFSSLILCICGTQAVVYHFAFFFLSNKCSCTGLTLCEVWHLLWILQFASTNSYNLMSYCKLNRSKKLYAIPEFAQLMKTFLQASKHLLLSAILAYMTSTAQQVLYQNFHWLSKLL